MSASFAPWTTAGLSIAEEGLSTLESIVATNSRVGGRFRLDHVEVRLVFGAFGAFQLLGADEVEGPVPRGDAGAVGEGDRAALAVAGGGVPADRSAGRRAAVVVARRAVAVDRDQTRRRGGAVCCYFDLVDVGARVGVAGEFVERREEDLRPVGRHPVEDPAGGRALRDFHGVAGIADVHVELPVGVAGFFPDFLADQHVRPVGGDVELGDAAGGERGARLVRGYDLGRAGFQVALVDPRRFAGPVILEFLFRAEDEVGAVGGEVFGDDRFRRRFARVFRAGHARLRRAAREPQRQVGAVAGEAGVADPFTAEGEIAQLGIGAEHRGAVRFGVRHPAAGQADVTAHPAVFGPFGDVGIAAVVRRFAGDRRAALRSAGCRGRGRRHPGTPGRDSGRGRASTRLRSRRRSRR